MRQTNPPRGPAAARRVKPFAGPIAILMLAAPASAQPAPERPSDPYLPPVVVGGYSGRTTMGQVDVDSQGRNIPGDAANEPSIAVDPLAPNRMVIVYRYFANVQSNFRQAGYSYTNDGGRTWHMSILQPGVFRSDPVVRADSDGTIYWDSLTSNGDTFECDLFRSNDGGATWSAPTPAVGGDKNWMTIDRSASIGRGNIYQTWTGADSQASPNNFNRSADHGLSFDPPLQMPRQIIWGTLAAGPDGELYTFGADSYFYLFKSSNARDAGSTPTFLDLSPNGLPLGGFESAMISSGPNPGGLLGQAYVAVDRSNGPHRGWVYILCSARPIGDPLDVLFRSSPDGGVSWNPIQRLNRDPLGPNSWQWFGTMSVAPNGRIDVIWNDTSESQNVRLSRLYYTSSADGGATWTTPAPQTAQWDSYLGWPNQNKIGDYYDMESDLLGANVAFAATFNGEQDVYYMRIGPRDCNCNGIDDDIDIATGLERDCNHNGIPDSCEIAAGTLADTNHDGLADQCYCFADFNHDGDIGTDADIEAFFACLGGNCCPSCGSADFNADGDVGTDADIEAFFRVLGGGSC